MSNAQPSGAPAAAPTRAATAPLDTPLETQGARAPRAVRCAVRGVRKSFGDNAILRGVDLDIHEGSFAVLVGPSGCGKSTLLRLVAGLETADQGTIELAGRDVTHLPPRDRDVAMVFQSYALYPHLTVRDNLAFGLRLRKVAPRLLPGRIGSRRDALRQQRPADEVMPGDLLDDPERGRRVGCG